MSPDPRHSRRDFLRLLGVAGVSLPCTSMFGSTASLPRSKVLSVDPTAQPTWCDGNGGGRNVFAHFRLTLHLAETPARAVLHLLAGPRYRLRVNHHILAYEPNAFPVAHPEFDSIDLVPWLRQGENEISDEVNS